MGGLEKGGASDGVFVLEKRSKYKMWRKVWLSSYYGWFTARKK